MNFVERFCERKQIKLGRNSWMITMMYQVYKAQALGLENIQVVTSKTTQKEPI